MPSQRSRAFSRREFLAWGGVSVLSLAAGTVAGNVYHAHVTHHRLELAKLRAPLKIAQLSDLHYGPYIHEGSVQAWVRLAQGQGADLIVITGDLVDRWLKRPLAPLAEALSSLAAPLGVWACLGNHDRVRFKDIAVLERALEAAGVGLLVNQGVTLRGDLYLAGVDDFVTGEPELAAAMQGLPGGAASVLLCHQPDFLPRMFLPVDLTLVGHTHGGQVRLPFVGAPFTSSRYGERFAQGWVDLPNRAYVSRGLGVSLLPVRWDCPAELAVFELSPQRL